MRVILCLIAVLSASALVAATQGAARASSCSNDIRTMEQAARAGEMPAIVAALHGGRPPADTSLLVCAARQR
jgi:hypothetical protein